MKTLIPLSLLAIAFLCGCTADKSSDIQTNVTPNGGVPHDAQAPKNGASTDPNIPAAARSAMPPTGK